MSPDANRFAASAFKRAATLAARGDLSLATAYARAGLREIADAKRAGRAA